MKAVPKDTSQLGARLERAIHSQACYLETRREMKSLSDLKPTSSDLVPRTWEIFSMLENHGLYLLRRELTTQVAQRSHPL